MNFLAELPPANSLLWMIYVEEHLVVIHTEFPEQVVNMQFCCCIILLDKTAQEGRGPEAFPEAEN